MSSLRRFSAHGDFWTRLLHLGARACPWWLEPVFITAYTLFFYLALGRVRRAIAHNLSVLHPGSSCLLNNLRPMAVFWNFAWTQGESIRQTSQPRRRILQWNIHGLEHFHALADGSRDRGIILITAHMGSYDLAAQLFAQQLHQRIHAVRVPERQMETQAYLEAKRDGIKDENYQIKYNTADGMLGLELVRQLANGEWVALQGDRVVGSVSPILVPVSAGVEWRLPRGPFFLALAAKSPMLPVFVRRTGWRRYAIEFHEPLNDVPQSRDRETAMLRLGTRWAALLRSVVQREWAQWLVFEPSFVLNPAVMAPPPEVRAYTAPPLGKEPKDVLAAEVWQPGGWLAGAVATVIFCSVLAWVGRYLAMSPFLHGGSFKLALGFAPLIAFVCIHGISLVLVVTGNITKRVWAPADEYALLTAGGVLWLAWCVVEIITYL